MTEQPIVTESKPRDRRALNAYRHGLTGQVHILTPEEQVAYEAHCLGIHQSLAPAAGIETDLVQSIADDRWRLKRASAIENSIFALGFSEPPAVVANHPQIDDALLQAQVWLSQGKNLQLLALYEGRIQRRVEKNFAMLRQLQHDRRAAQPQPRPQPMANKKSLHEMPVPKLVFSSASAEPQPAAEAGYSAPVPGPGPQAPGLTTPIGVLSC